MNFFPLLATALAASFGTPSFALPAKDVSAKLNSIIIFAPVDPKFPDAPITFKQDVDGRDLSVYFAAFSPSAAQKVLSERISPNDPKKAKSITFAAFSLSKFDSIVEKKLETNQKSRVIYIPDPDQSAMAKKLLLDQGTKLAVANQISKDVPVVFCPSPAIKATLDSGPMKGKSFVPCSTDYSTLRAMIDKGIKTDREVKKNNPKILAIPIPNFAAMLASGTDDSLNSVEVVPSPSSINAINQLKTKKAP